MVILRVTLLATILVSILGTVVVALPDIIQSSEWGIQYLWREAFEGRLRYDLQRDVPPLQEPWNRFLHEKGGPIINTHYREMRGHEGWNANDREL